MMLKVVFEYAIIFNMAEAHYYVKEEGSDNKYVLEHRQKAQNFKVLLDELELQ